MPDNRFWRDFSKHLTFGLASVPATDYPAQCNSVATAFSLTPDHGSFGVGLDQISQDYQRGEFVVEMAWDNWTGFTVVAKAPGAESLVREIGYWLLRRARAE